MLRQWWDLAETLIAKYSSGYVTLHEGDREAMGYPKWWLCQAGTFFNFPRGNYGAEKVPCPKTDDNGKPVDNGGWPLPLPASRDGDAPGAGAAGAEQPPRRTGGVGAALIAAGEVVARWEELLMRRMGGLN